ncbi:hypothetical protein COO60DRAFT_1492148 [Scenedesmus sp. NREL 46B-D3]|nr:hypothetical protein COO60DRAFT_1492148 [Scenedesmus sp. NREL 46B-D3]
MRHQSIPVDDADSSAWEDALSLMYPAVPLFQVTWGSAARLLLLADKYDMPAVAEHVRIFLDTPREAFAPTAGGAAAAPAGPRRLEAQLSSGSTPGLPNVFEWLQVTDKCGLEQHAQTCIQYIIQHQLPIPAGLVSSIQPHHAEALFNAMQQALRNVQALLQQAALPSQEYACACCGNRWHQLPRSGQLPSPSGRRQLSQQAAACVHCGEDVQQRLQGSLAAGAAAEADADHGLSESLGTTDEGADADDTDDEEEGDEDESDEAMSQDSSSQGADDDADELGGSEEDAMQSGSGASGSVSTALTR